MTKNIFVIIFFLIASNQITSQNDEQIVIGIKQILHSNVLNENREY